MSDGEQLIRHDGSTPRPGPSRRLILTGVAAGALGAAGLGLAGPAEASTLSTNRIFFDSGRRSAWLFAEPQNGGLVSSASSFVIETGFYVRLQTWLTWCYAFSPGAWQDPFNIYTLGTYTPTNQFPAHTLARAIDLAKILVTVNGSRQTAGNFRHDLFSTSERATGSLAQKRYWGWAASVFRFLQYTLHYEYNSAHDSHIHADNMLSGAGDPTFSTGSTTQVKFVQASLRHIWGYSLAVDGAYGPATDGAVRKALARTGVSGSVTTSTANWWRYCEETAKFGWGSAAY